MATDAGEIEYLFRFRDLVANTIDEHRKIIEGDAAAVWWGWWKRPSENERLDVWQALRASASAANPVKVGLFDSGRDLVFPALVTQVVIPGENLNRLDLPKGFPEDERDLIPPYYRESAYSPGWMKLVEIREPIEFFGRYSYREAPVVLHYPPAVLARFVAKVILAADELRSMDTTIWKVRGALPTDAREQILLGSPALPSAVTTEVVSCNSDVLLHITDPHFSLGKHRSQHIWRLESEPADGRATMAEAIAQALKDKPVGAVLVTGDLTFLGSKEEFAEAQLGLAQLLKLLGLGPDHLVIVPGNHDIQWSATDTYEKGDELLPAPPHAVANYSEFYRNLFRHEPDQHLAMGRRYLLPSGVAIEICGLNSSTLATGKDFLPGMGRINEHAFTATAGEMGWKRKSSSLALRILAIHHHLALTEDLERAEGYGAGYGLAVDAVKVQRMARGFGVQLAMHGHKHRAFIWRYMVYALPEFTTPNYQLGEISIIGGGSAGSTETDGERNYFNLLAATPAGLHLTIYRSAQGGSFDTMQCWDGAFSIDEEMKRLALAEWQLAENPHSC